MNVYLMCSIIEIGFGLEEFLSPVEMDIHRLKELKRQRSTDRQKTKIIHHHHYYYYYSIQEIAASPALPFPSLPLSFLPDQWGCHPGRSS